MNTPTARVGFNTAANRRLWAIRSEDVRPWAPDGWLILVACLACNSVTLDFLGEEEKCSRPSSDSCALNKVQEDTAGFTGYLWQR